MEKLIQRRLPEVGVALKRSPAKLIWILGTYSVNGAWEFWKGRTISTCRWRGTSHKEVVELLIANGADVNPKDMKGQTPLDMTNHPEIADILRKHGGKTGEELKAEGK